MSGNKRNRDGSPKDKPAANMSSSPFMPMFETFRAELDEHHDRREKTIKASRDITALSKKIIFSLQRVRNLKEPIPPKIAAEVNDRFTQILALFASVAPDLQGLNAWRYQRNISGGIQEYLEALSFGYYLEHQRYITHAECSNALALPAATPHPILVTHEDYLLGLFDLSGEMMRFAITTMATTGTLARSKDAVSGDERTILSDMQALRSCMEGLIVTGYGNYGLGKDIKGKMEVLKQSVEKVEKAVFEMIVRGRERPKGWMPDLTEDRVGVESY